MKIQVKKADLTPQIGKHLELNSAESQRALVIHVEFNKDEGQVESFDQFVILLKNSVSQLVYKHAVSTIVPARNVKIPRADEDSGEEG